MLIVPYIHKVTNQNNINIHSIRILTIGGKQIWEEKDSLNIDKDILNPNDIYRKNDIIKIDKKLILCEVDMEKTNINDIYKWSEIDINDNETFCWRDYIYFIGNDNENWLNIPKNEKLGDVNINKIISSIIDKSLKK